MSTDSSVLADYLLLEADLAAGPLAAPTYAPLMSTLIAGTVSRGRAAVGPDDVAQTGTASFTVDNTGHELDTGTWHRGKHIRLATIGGTELFTGFGDRVRHDQSGAPFRSFATITCVDSRYAKQRATIADLLGVPVPTNGRLIPPGLHAPWQPPDFGDPIAGTYDVAELVRQWVDNECGTAWTLADGSQVILDRWWRMRELDTGTIPLFSDDEADTGAFRILAQADGGLLELSEPEEAYRDRIEFTGTSGVTQITENVPADYDPVALSRSTQCPDDRWMKANTRLLLDPGWYTAPYWRRFTVRAAPNDPAVMEQLALIDLGKLISVRATPVGAPVDVTSQVFVESIDHTFSAESCTWDITFGCSSADAWGDTWGPFSNYLAYDAAMTYDGSKKYLP